MSIRITRYAAVVGLVAAGLGSSGCLIHSRSRTQYSGKQVGEATFDRIEEGKSTPEFVLATLGEPTRKTPLSDGTEVWKWEYRKTQSSSGSVFLLYGGSGHSEHEGAAFVTIKDGVVSKKWRD